MTEEEAQKLAHQIVVQAYRQEMTTEEVEVQCESVGLKISKTMFDPEDFIPFKVFRFQNENNETRTVKLNLEEIADQLAMHGQTIDWLKF